MFLIYVRTAHQGINVLAQSKMSNLLDAFCCSKKFSVLKFFKDRMSVKNIKLSKLNQFFLKKDLTNKILQFSPPRSGSTLIYNILREIFPEKEITKQHTYRHIISRYPVVVSYRHPLDCIASSIQRYGLSPTNEVIEQQIIEFEENGISDILKIKNKKNVLMLRYEDFFDNFNNIYDSIDQFFDIKISCEMREDMTSRYQIQNIEKIVSSKNTFSEYDTMTHWHGNHISKYKGKPYYYQEFFTKDQIKFLKDVYSKYLSEFKYN